MPVPTETTTYECGKCTYTTTSPFANITEQIDPTCDVHKETSCKVCGVKADQLTISHGSFGRLHTVER